MPFERNEPLAWDHPLVLVDARCPACDTPFLPGDITALISMGPGGNPEARKAAREGRPYNPVALPVHFVCATGIEE